MALTNKQRQYIEKNRASKSPKEIASILKLDKAEVIEYLDQTADKPLSKEKKRLFLGIALSIPIIFFLLLEAGLRIGNYKGDQSLFMFPETLDGKYGISNNNFNSRYFFNTQTIPSASNDVFLAEKPENSFRIFVLGGSSAAGYPYGYNGTFSRLTRDVLQDVMPDKIVEVVNVATSAINTYTLYDQVSEILEQKPDAIMIYGGHNEFYGALGVGSSESLGSFPAFVRSYLKLQRLKTFMLVRDLIVKTAGYIGSTIGGGEAIDPSGTLMQRVVREQSIPLDSKTYELGKVQFQSNLSAILSEFQKAEVPVFIGSLASNLKDHPPFFSEGTESHPPADQIFRSATTDYLNNDYESAFDRFQYARDLDVLRFRASSEFNEIIRDKATEHNAVYVPVKEFLTERAENGIIGFDLMLEHLHPNEYGYFLIGRAFYESIADQNFIGFSANTSLLKDWDEYRAGMQLTEFDNRIAWHRIQLLTTGWPFVLQPDPMRYPRNYRTISIADSLAFDVVHKNTVWDRAKVELADHYRSAGKYEKALAEYRGLMREQHFSDSPFVFGARVALDMNDMQLAKPLLERAYEIEPSNFTCRMLGAIEVDEGNLERGKLLLHEALEFNSTDAQALFNLSGAYGLSGDYQEALNLADRLVRINPNFPGLQPWREQLIQITNR